MLLFLKNMLQLMLSPKHGWEDISACDTPVERLLHRGFYPMIALSAASVFARAVYSADASIAGLVVMCFVTFMTFFSTYFLARGIFKTVVHSFCLTVPGEKKYSTVILYTLSLLCLAVAIYHLLPVRLGLEYILPLVTALVLCKSTVYMGVDPEKEYSYIAFAIAVVILPPLLIQQFFQWILS